MCTRSGGPVLFYSDLLSKHSAFVWMDLRDGKLTMKNGRSITILEWDVANLKTAIIPELPCSFVVSNKTIDSLCFCTLIDTLQRNKWLNHFTRLQVPVVGASGRPLIKKSRHQKLSISDCCTNESSDLIQNKNDS